MILKSFSLVINCFGYQNDPNGYDLFMFGIGSLVVISFLLWYYNNIPKSNFKKVDSQTERKVSRSPELILYLLITIPSIIMFVEFFNFGNLFTSFDVIALSSLATFILYLNITPEIKKLIKRPKLDNPIYKTKDILLQSNNNDANFILVENTTSTLVKTFVYFMILVLVFTPVYKLLGTGYFL